DVNGDREARALQLIEWTIQDALQDENDAMALAECAQAVVFTAGGRYGAACEVARRASCRPDAGHLVWALSELVEAGPGSGALTVPADALHRLEMRGDSDDWALGILFRSRALLANGDDVEPLYLAAIDCFVQAGLALHRARTQLLYGEWLRREHLRVDAR